MDGHGTCASERVLPRSVGLEYRAQLFRRMENTLEILLRLNLEIIDKKMFVFHIQQLLLVKIGYFS